MAQFGAEEVIEKARYWLKSRNAKRNGMLKT